MSGTSTVLHDRPAPQVRRVTLNRPERLNALDHGTTAELKAVLADIRTDRDCRVVILTGAGRAFCAGLDLKGYGDDDLVQAEGEVGRMLTRQREIADLAIAVHELPQPVIAAVNGPAAGGGLALVCASDIRIGTPAATCAVSFISAGFSACDIGVSWLLPRIVGAGAAHELMLTGRKIDGHEAARIGLLGRIVEPDDLMDAALGIAAEICRNPPLSVELTKQGMWIALETPSFRAAVEFENRQQVFTALTRDRAEATAAFLERRDPSYERR